MHKHIRGEMEHHLLSITAEFLAKGQRSRVLGVGPSNLDNVIELLRLFKQCCLQFEQVEF